MKTLNDYVELLSDFIPEKLILSCYRSICKNDPAHNVDHVYSVCEYSVELTQRIPHEDRVIILLGCLMHDLGCRYDRSSHHLISYGLVFKFLDKYPNLLNDEDRMHVAKSCLEHRASWSGNRSSIYSDHVAVADRGRLDLNEFIHRCKVYRQSKGVIDKEALLNEIFEHIREKCGTDGYMWKTYPKLGWELNSELISGIMCVVDDKHLLGDLIYKHVYGEVK